MDIDKADLFYEKLVNDIKIHPEGIYTHFATADEGDLEYASSQLSKFKDVIERMNQLDNVVVRLSSDSVQGKKVNFSTWRLNSIKTSSTILPKDTDDVFSSDHTGVNVDKSHVVCRAYENDGKCGSCRECWSKDTHTIAYVAHGKSMGKVLKDINELGYARINMVG